MAEQRQVFVVEGPILRIFEGDHHTGIWQVEPRRTVLAVCGEHDLAVAECELARAAFAAEAAPAMGGDGGTAFGTYVWGVSTNGRDLAPVSDLDEIAALSFDVVADSWSASTDGSASGWAIGFDHHLVHGAATLTSPVPWRSFDEALRAWRVGPFSTTHYAPASLPRSAGVVSAVPGWARGSRGRRRILELRLEPGAQDPVRPPAWPVGGWQWPTAMQVDPQATDESASGDSMAMAWAIRAAANHRVDEAVYALEGLAAEGSTPLAALAAAAADQLRDGVAPMVVASRLDSWGSWPAMWTVDDVVAVGLGQPDTWGMVVAALRRLGVSWQEVVARDPAAFVPLRGAGVDARGGLVRGFEMVEAGLVPDPSWPFVVDDRAACGWLFDPAAPVALAAAAELGRVLAERGRA